MASFSCNETFQNYGEEGQLPNFVNDFFRNVLLYFRDFSFSFDELSRDLYIFGELYSTTQKGFSNQKRNIIFHYRKQFRFQKIYAHLAMQQQKWKLYAIWTLLKHLFGRS